MALLDGDGEVFRPAAAEIDVNRAAALADRQNLALNHCETTPNLEDPGRILGISHHIVRVGPKAKTGRAGTRFRAQKCGSAAFIADISRKSGLREQSLLDGLPGFCGLQRGQSHHSAVAVGVGPIFARNISRPETRVSSAALASPAPRCRRAGPPGRPQAAGCGRRPRVAPVQCRLRPVCSRIDRPPAPQPRGAAPVQWRWQRDGSLNRSRTTP
jgi:hypothetical protein